MQGTFSFLTLCHVVFSTQNVSDKKYFFLKVINVFLVVCWNDKNGTCKEQVPTKRERLKGWTRSFSREVGCCFKLRLWSRLSPSSLRDHSASTSWTMTQPFSRQPSPTIIYLQATIVNYQRRKERGKTTDLEFFFYNFKSHWDPHLYTIYKIIFSVTRRSKSDSVSESLSH